MKRIDCLINALLEQLRDEVVGIYLHGSMAMGCFNPMTSDVDLLVVTRAGLSVQAKRSSVETLLLCSKRPFPIEISFLCLTDLHPWRHPAPFDLHYSETWRQQFQEDLSSGAWLRWNDQRRCDPDLAAHITVLRARGLCWYGQPITAIFPDIPRADYLVSIMGNVAEARDRIAEMPVYAVLNLCRVYRYLVDGAVNSKEESGDWALTKLPDALRSVVAAALVAYRGSEAPTFDEAALRRFATDMDARLQALARSG